MYLYLYLRYISKVSSPTLVPYNSSGACALRTHCSRDDDDDGGGGADDKAIVST